MPSDTTTMADSAILNTESEFNFNLEDNKIGQKIDDGMTGKNGGSESTDLKQKGQAAKIVTQSSSMDSQMGSSRQTTSQSDYTKCEEDLQFIGAEETCLLDTEYQNIV